MKEFSELTINGVPLALDLDMVALYDRMERYQSIRRRHANTEYEVVLILRGACMADVEEHHHIIRQGQGVIIPPDCYHILVGEPGPYERFAFRFLPQKDGEFARSLRRQLSSHCEFSVTPEMERLVTAMYETYEGRAMYWRELFLTLLKQLLLRILAQLQLGADGPASGGDNFCRASRATVIDRYIEQDLGSATVDGLAKHMHLSRRQTMRVLHDTFRMNFQEKLFIARMDRAAWLLRTTDLPVDRLIDEVGYASISAFYHAFRKYFGMTPQQYRKEYSGT